MGWENPLEEEMATHSNILAWETLGQRSLAGYSAWGRKELDMTEAIENSYPVIHCFMSSASTLQLNTPLIVLSCPCINLVIHLFLSVHEHLYTYTHTHYHTLLLFLWTSCYLSDQLRIRKVFFYFPLFLLQYAVFFLIK